MALLNSSILTRVERCIWTITGYSFASEALQRAQEKRHTLRLVVRPREDDVPPPASTFKRSARGVPAKVARSSRTHGKMALSQSAPFRHIVEHFHLPSTRRGVHALQCLEFDLQGRSRQTIPIKQTSCASLQNFSLVLLSGMNSRIPCPSHDAASFLSYRSGPVFFTL